MIYKHTLIITVPLQIQAIVSTSVRGQDFYLLACLNYTVISLALAEVFVSRRMILRAYVDYVKPLFQVCLLEIRDIY